eukprot:1215344-Pleurochrysis_carterae.AAC.1
MRSAALSLRSLSTVRYNSFTCSCVGAAFAFFESRGSGASSCTFCLRDVSPESQGAKASVRDELEKDRPAKRSVTLGGESVRRSSLVGRGDDGGDGGGDAEEIGRI